MTTRLAYHPVLTAILAAGLTACAGAGNLLTSPDVRLNHVEVTELDFSRQVFRLAFDVSNPNPFPLPVSRIQYGIDLDGRRFASGETGGGFTVPARGDLEFAISVELDLLHSAPQLLYTVRDAAHRNVPYTLRGQLGVDLPLLRAVEFATTGDIRLKSR